MLRKHINDDTQHSVDVKGRDDVVGPCQCPQTGCQSTDGSGPYRKGNVVVEEYGGSSGAYVTSFACKCCDSKGYLSSGERPYRSYCFAYSVRDLSTIYPSPHPMPRAVYDDSELQRRVQEKKQPQAQESKGGCYIATAVYGSYDHPSVLALRDFRDRRLETSFTGRCLIRAYYKISPPLARRLKEKTAVNTILRKLLDQLVAATEGKI